MVRAGWAFSCMPQSPQCPTESQVVTNQPPPPHQALSLWEPVAPPCLPVLALSLGMKWVCMYHRLSKQTEHEGPSHQPLAQICELPFLQYSLLSLPQRTLKGAGHTLVILPQQRQSENFITHTFWDSEFQVRGASGPLDLPRTPKWLLLVRACF